MEPAAPDGPLAHTGTQQWQNFEMRMRQRRIDRLLLRAGVAVDAGCVEDARQALEELECLKSDAPRIAELRARLTQPLVARPVAPDLELRPPVLQTIEEPRKRSAWGAPVAAILLVLSLLGGFVAVRTPGPITIAVLSKPFVPQNSQSQPTAQPQGTTSPPVQVSVEDVATSNLVDEQAPEPLAEQPSLPQVQPRDTPSWSINGVTAKPVENLTAAPAPVAAPIAAAPPAVPVATAPPLERAPLEPPPSAPPVPAPPEPAPPVTPPAVTVEPPDTPAPDTPSAVNEDLGVRTALARYESAYSRLDAEAAGAVWPSLDRRALARAFDGLASQRVELGACDVRIVGETAVAECAGSATWTPRVGGGAHTQRRRWQFRLRNSSGSWQIVGATVR